MYTNGGTMQNYILSLAIVLLCNESFGTDIALTGDRVSYGTVFIKNNTDWALKITADLKDEWDNVTQTEWQIPSQGTEKIANLFFLRNVRFKPVVEDESKVEAWLRKSHPIRITSRPESKDLIIYIAKSRYGNRWDIKQRFVIAAKVEYGGPVGYQLKIIIP